MINLFTSNVIIVRTSEETETHRRRTHRRGASNATDHHMPDTTRYEPGMVLGPSQHLGMYL
jgi:hypothetical protein